MVPQDDGEDAEDGKSYCLRRAQITERDKKRICQRNKQDVYASGNSWCVSIK
jgi:hypothetical protein